MQREEDPQNAGREGRSQIDTLSSFLPFIPVVVQKRLVHAESDRFSESANVDTPPELVSEWSGGGARSVQPGKLKGYILSSLVKSPIPLRVIRELASDAGFTGLPLIEEAVESAAIHPLMSESRESTDEGDTPKSKPINTQGVEKEVQSVSFPDDLDDEALLSRAFEELFELLGEERTGQLRMALAVLDAMREGKTLVVEAGTGTGKSIAYLIPAIVFAVRSGERVVISTYTKHLQSQLYSKDIPVAISVLGSNIRTARLMGRDNYICIDRAMRVIRKARKDDPSYALSVALSAAFSDEGLVYSLSGLPDDLAYSRLAPPKRCLMGECYYSQRCPLVIARNTAMNASIVLANHSLVITDYLAGGSMLGEYSCIIFDEAHNVERAAIENLVVELSRSLLNEILEPLDFIRRDDEKWRFMSAFFPGGLKKKREEILDAVNGLKDSIGAFFEGITEKFNRDRLLRSTRTRYEDGREKFGEFRSNIVNILFECNKLYKSLESLVEMNLPSDASQVQRELSFVLDELESLRSEVEFLTSAEDDDYVFWLEWGPGGELSDIAASPVFVDRQFADLVESVCESAVFTSATLSQGGSFDFFVTRLGINRVGREVKEISIPSPFPFNENCGVFLASDAPAPRDETFPSMTARVIEDLAGVAGKRVLVLFTSYRMCRAVADSIVDPSVKERLIVQGYGDSREILAEKLRMSVGGVLMGVASFWEGVDFPGEELEVLVITKIPFLVPTEPIVEARAKKLRARGEDPFETMQIPEAILKLKQGVGRLIRRNEDRGVVVLLDSRLIRMRYGDAILSELPTSRVEVVPMSELAERVLRWFSR